MAASIGKGRPLPDFGGATFSPVTPSLLAQTALIERGVVQIEGRANAAGHIVVREPVLTLTSSSRERSFGIGEDEFYENLEQNVPGASSLLKSFLAKAESLGVYADLQGGLNLKHAAPNGKPLNLGTIAKGGIVDTGPATWFGRSEIGRRYNEMLASQIGGSVKEELQKEELQQSAVRTAAGKMPRISNFLPQHEGAWLAAIERYVKEIFETSKEL